MLSAFCEEQIVEILKEWDCIGIKEFEPSGYDDAASFGPAQETDPGLCQSLRGSRRRISAEGRREETS